MPSRPDMPHTTPESDKYTPEDCHVQWSIWVNMIGDWPPTLREVLTDVPIGKAYENAMKFQRDEGWDDVHVQRRLKRKE